MTWTQISVEGESFPKRLIYVLLHVGLLVNFTDHLLFVYNFKGQRLSKLGMFQSEAQMKR